MKFRIWYTIINYAYADIEAETLDEAEKVAEDMDGSEFEKVSDPSWMLDHKYNIQYNRMLKMDNELLEKRFKDIYGYLVNLTDDEAVLHNREESRLLGKLLDMMEYLQGTWDENPVPDWFGKLPDF